MTKRSLPKPADTRGQHGATQLPGLSIDSYNLAIHDPEGEGFLGDRASQTAFRDLLDKARKHRTRKDPFGKERSDEVGKKAIDLVLIGGDPDAAHLVHIAVEEYARRLAHVVRCFLAQQAWEGVERIVLGGGLPESKTGGLAIRRAMRLLKQSRAGVELHILQHDADEAGLLGWTHLLPSTARKRHHAFLAVDVGGTNLRCGIVEHRLGDEEDGSKARVIEHMRWRHADDEPNRDEAVVRLAGMLNGLAAQARTLGVKLAPFIGIACPGQIQEDGSILHGAQNLPGDWEAPFNLPQALGERLDRISGARATVVMHNDAVVQGLSERVRMRKAPRWGVLTIGTGLGNASYTNT
jgi:predicted NBD/HSP70 family sugar kinase